MTVDHDELRADCGLYALGALRGSERTRLEEHLQTCEECRRLVQTFRRVADALPYGVPMVDVPRGVDARILMAASRVRPPRIGTASTPSAAPIEARSSRDLSRVAAWVAVAASVIVAIGFGYRAADSRGRLRQTEQRLSDALGRLADTDQRLQASLQENTTVRRTLALLTASDSVELRLVGQAPARQASGRAFLSRSRGVLFTMSNLPAIPADRTYQVWYLTGAAPISAGLIRPDSDGGATVTFNPPTGPALVGMAVSLEPAGGVPAPTGSIYLATQ